MKTAKLYLFMWSQLGSMTGVRGVEHSYMGEFDNQPDIIEFALNKKGYGKWYISVIDSTGVEIYSGFTWKTFKQTTKLVIKREHAQTKFMIYGLDADKVIQYLGNAETKTDAFFRIVNEFSTKHLTAK